MRMKLLSAAIVAIGLSACANVEFPKDGTPSPYDGKWSGDLTRIDGPTACNGLTVAGEIRNGYFIGEVNKSGRTEGQLWGALTSNGKLDGTIGKAGLSNGAKGVVQFTESTATGTWQTNNCAGKVTLKKVG